MRQPRGLAACLPIALALLCGCSSTRSPQAAPLPPAGSASPAATPSPSPMPSPATAAVSSPAAEVARTSIDVPFAATANTPQGAGAFTLFYFDELLKAYTTQDTRAIRTLAAESCKGCAGLAGGIDSLRDNHRRVTGAPIKVLSAETPGFGYGPVVVDLQYITPAYDIVDANDKIVRRFSAEKRNLFFVSLTRTGTGWLIGRIQVP